MNDMMFLAAPLQGYTDLPWRRFHDELFGGIDRYVTPFLRVEKGAVRTRDLKEIGSSMNDRDKTIVQIIFKSADEMRLLTESVIEAGYREIDLNMGCPFPPQVKKGRGAGLLLQKDVLSQVAALTHDYENISFSVKMRLGVDDCSQWRLVRDEINQMRLSHVTVHPRSARQQYSGDLDYEMFEEVTAAVAHPIVFNGELKSVSDIDSIVSRFSTLKGIMIGRGLLCRPTLAAEWKTKKESDSESLKNNLIKLHDAVFSFREKEMPIEAQLLSKMKSFWDYAEPVIGHKMMKAIKKSNSIRAYLSAIGAM